MVLAGEIPVAHTPEGFWQGEMPPPVLAACTEPLAAEAFDMRGLWKAVAVDGEAIDGAGHVERIEQCGNRVVITSGGVIHDMTCDGTLENGVNDVSGFNGAPISVASGATSRMRLPYSSATLGETAMIIITTMLVHNAVPLHITSRP